MTAPTEMTSPTLSFDRIPDGTLVARLGGPWHQGPDTAASTAALSAVLTGRVTR